MNDLLLQTHQHNKQRIISLDALRVISILGVVAIHVFGLVYINPSIKETLQWKISAFIDIGCVWCVPAFVMLSGYLNLRTQAQMHGPKAFYTRRVKPLIIPLVFWHIFYLTIVRIFINESRVSPAGIIQNIIDGKIYTALYFFWLILGLYLVAPILYSFISQGGGIRSLILGGALSFWTILIYIAIGTSNYLGNTRRIDRGSLTMGLFFTGYFVLGNALGNFRLNAKQRIASILLLTLLVLELIWQNAFSTQHLLINILNPGNAFGIACTLATVLIFLVFISSESFFQRLKIERVLSQFSDLAFGVFCIHLFYLAIAMRVFGAAQISRLPAATATYFVIVIASFLTSAIMRKIPFLRKLF